MNNNYQELYKKIDYEFKDKELLVTALSHPSLCYSKNKKCNNYERFELLGDSVLSLVVLDMLLRKYPKLDEGEIAKRKSYLVCTDALADIARKFGLGQYIYMTKGEEKLDGRSNPHILENVIESIIGAIYLDGGIDGAKKFIAKYWTKPISEQKKIEKDPKTRLQEWTQKKSIGIPQYNFLSKNGTDSDPMFRIEVVVKDFPHFVGEDKSKKGAEVNSAYEMVEYIKNNVDKNI